MYTDFENSGATKSYKEIVFIVRYYSLSAQINSEENYEFMNFFEKENCDQILKIQPQMVLKIFIIAFWFLETYRLI